MGEDDCLLEVSMTFTAYCVSTLQAAGDCIFSPLPGSSELRFCERRMSGTHAESSAGDRTAVVAGPGGREEEGRGESESVQE